MIESGFFRTEPWLVREASLDLGVLAQSESIFALANGHLGLRGNLDEGEPSGLPGTYLNGVYELRPLPYAEAGFGYPESGQTCINVTNGKVIRLLVDDEPFDVRYGTLRAHERVLDLRAGTLQRRVECLGDEELVGVGDDRHVYVVRGEPRCSRDRRGQNRCRAELDATEQGAFLSRVGR